MFCFHNVFSCVFSPFFYSSSSKFNLRTPSHNLNLFVVKKNVFAQRFYFLFFLRFVEIMPTMYISERIAFWGDPLMLGAIRMCPRKPLFHSTSRDSFSDFFFLRLFAVAQFLMSCNIAHQNLHSPSCRKLKSSMNITQKEKRKNHSAGFSRRHKFICRCGLLCKRRKFQISLLEKSLPRCDVIVGIHPRQTPKRRNEMKKPREE